LSRAQIDGISLLIKCESLFFRFSPKKEDYGMLSMIVQPIGLGRGGKGNMVVSLMITTILIIILRLKE